MTLRSKIVSIGIAVVLLVCGSLFWLYQREAKQQVVQQYVEKSRSIVLTAESTREEMGKKWEQGIFSADLLKTWAKEGAHEKILSAVPVVTAWRAAMGRAEEGGYTFKVPKFQPRNPKNEPDELEARVLRLFETGKETEHFEVDDAQNALRFFRPVRLTQECLLCHGDPKNSEALWGRTDGRDPTGGPMENWKVGEVHGAFEVVQSLNEADARIAGNVKRGALVILALIALSGAVFFFGVPWIINRDLVRPIAQMVQALTDGATQVTAAAGEVAGSSQGLSQGATEQAASLEETSASMEEMASMTRRNAESTQEASSLMQNVSSLMNDSNAALGGMVQSMSAIRDSSNKVSKIIKTIDEIAFQTNILALNAAVEAARAGEAGMGFAVVADEVRNLAQRSAQAAKDTTGLIEEAISNAQDGNRRVEEVAQSIGSITESVTKMRQLVQDVNEASRQQAQGIDQVAQAITQMEKVTQSTAATAEESAAASEQLSAQAEATLDVVRKLASLVGAKAESSMPPGRQSGKKPALSFAPAPKATHKSRAEEAIPLEDTGTFGSF